MRIKTELELSESGKIMRLYNDSTGQLISEILVHGFLSRAALMSADVGGYIYRGELFQLAGYEYLSIKDEIIIERENERTDERASVSVPYQTTKKDII